MDVYGEVRTFEFPGMVVRVHSPVLSQEERAHRMQTIYSAAAKLLAQASKANKSALGFENGDFSGFSGVGEQSIDRE